MNRLKSFGVLIVGYIGEMIGCHFKVVIPTVMRPIFFMKRLFVYFLIINYLHLSLAPSFVMAMDKDSLQTLPRLQAIKPSSQDEEDGWERPPILSPAAASQKLPTLKLSLQRQKNGSYQLEMTQKDADPFKEILSKGKVKRDYQGHKIDLSLGEALVSQVVFTTINPACNYLFDIDGHLSLGGSLETAGYFQVIKSNSFSFSSILLADSGIFLDNIKMLIHEGTTTPRVIAKRGPIVINQTGDDKSLEIKAVLEASTGIKIETDTGDLVISSAIKTPSTIFLKSKGNTLLKKTALTGVGGIELTGAGTVMTGEDLITLLTNKQIGIKAKRFDLKTGNYVGAEGIYLQGDDVSVGSETSEPLFQSNGTIKLKGKEKLFLKSGGYHSGEELILEGSDIIVGVPKTGMNLNPYWQQQEQFDKHYIETHLLPVIRKGIASNPIYANYAHFMANRERAGYKAGMSLADYRALVLETHGQKLQKLGLRLPEYELPVTLMRKEDYDRAYIERCLLPALRNLTSHPAYRSYQEFVGDPGTGYRKGMNLHDYRQSWINSQKYGKAIKDKGLIIPVYKPPFTFIVYPKKKVVHQEWCGHFRDHEDKTYDTPHFVEILKQRGLENPSWPEISDFMDIIQKAMNFNDLLIKQTVERFTNQRVYNQSLQIKSTHSAGKGLVVPFQGQVIVHGTLQT